ncbi:hypothetical protein LguiA_002189 [Lonicera macranthoides]
MAVIIPSTFTGALKRVIKSLFKSKWEKSGQIPFEDYECVDINVNGTCYIIEIFLAGEFEIARPTRCYTLLVELSTYFRGKNGGTETSSEIIVQCDEFEDETLEEYDNEDVIADSDYDNCDENVEDDTLEEHNDE